jgi:LmbE family N-acetylglucosaminyl deacetylase
VALVFSPHPDDECLIGGLALRLMREAKMRVINIAVTHGSNPARQPGRWQELSDACKWIGFEVERTAPNGLEKINVKTRAQSPEHWKTCVQAIAAKLAQHKPSVIFVPHELDSNSTHIGTHFLVMDALQSMPAEFECFIVETEFWGQMASPNLMVELSKEDLADLLAALSFHVEEVKRNPYHVGLPAWMRDNVRRGAELVGAQGGAAPDYMFATLYRLRQWKNGRAEDAYKGGKQISLKDSPGEVFNSPCSQTC